MVANADRMIANTRAAGSGRAGGFVVGFNNSVSAGNLRATLVAAQRENPDLKINGVESDRSALFAGLDSGEIDIASRPMFAARTVRNIANRKSRRCAA
jgi:DNA-binding transcriptional LysR family regulator|tara:strand:- start:247 stop:540 length:294 start_codon:yes stop_codon:yes gene_type:complete